MSEIKEIIKELRLNSLTTKMDNLITSLESELSKQSEADKKEGVCLAIGWMYGEACSCVDHDEDIRRKNVPKLLERALIDLEIKETKE